MLPRATLDRLADWESRFDVACWRCGPVPAWPLLRIMLGFRLLASSREARATDARAVPERRIGELAEVARAVRAAMADPAHEASLRGDADAVFLSRPANRERLGGHFWDRFFDPLTDLLAARGLRALTLEVHGVGTEYRLPRRSPSRMIRPWVSAEQAAAAVAQRLRPWRLHAPGYDALAAEAAAWIEPPSPARVALRLRATDRLAVRIESLLRRRRTRLVACTAWYGDLGMAACLAASRAGVPSVDVQHGVTALNPGYDGWTAFPDGGYATVPTRFWCWRPADAAPVDGWPTEAHDTLVGGQPWTAFWRSDRPETEAARARIASLRGPRTALVSLSWSSGLSEPLEAILTAATDWTFWVRLHPLMDAERGAIERWAERFGGRVVVGPATDLPLPLLLREVDAHVTHNSTVIQEAAAAGVPSLAIDPRALDTYADEIAAGWAVHPVGDPVEALRALPGRPRPAPAPYPDLAAADAALRTLLPGPGRAHADRR